MRAFARCTFPIFVLSTLALLCGLVSSCRKQVVEQPAPETAAPVATAQPAATPAPVATPAPEPKPEPKIVSEPVVEPRFLLPYTTTVEVSGPKELEEAAKNAAPGTRILMAPGDYQRDPSRKTIIWLEGIKGTPDGFIQMVAKDPDNPPQFLSGDYCVNFNKCSYFMFDGAVVKGANINNLQINFCDHFIIRNVEVGKMVGTGNNDGIKMPGSTDFLIADCSVTGWGGGSGSGVDCVGCARGLFYRCKLEYPDMQGWFANGLQWKGGSFNMGAYKCVFITASTRAVQFGGSSGLAYFHQNNLDKGYECYDSVVMGSLFMRNERSIAFISCTNCRAEYNTIAGSTGSLLRILKEGGTHPTGGNYFCNNLVLGNSSISSGDGVDPASFVYENNFWEGSVPNMQGQQSGDACGPVALDPEGKPLGEGEFVTRGAHAAALAKAWSEHTAKFDWAWSMADKM